MIILNNNFICKKRGFTLTEIAIVLGIIGLLLGAIWTAASTVYTTRRVSEESKEMINLLSNARTLFAQMPQEFPTTYGYNLTPDFINLGLFPVNKIVPCVGPQFTYWGPTSAGTAGCAIDGWGTHEIAIGTNSGWGVTPIPGDFVIALSTMNKGDCKTFVPRFAIQGANLGLVSIYSDFAGTMAITPATTMAATEAFFASCSGNVVFQFIL